MTEEWADRVAFGIVGLAAVVLVVNLILALASPTPAPEPTKIPCTEIPCKEADGACLCWSEMHYPGSEWKP